MKQYKCSKIIVTGGKMNKHYKFMQRTPAVIKTFKAADLHYIVIANE